VGAAFHNGFAFELPIAPSLVASVSGTKVGLDGTSSVSIAANGSRRVSRGR